MQVNVVPVIPISMATCLTTLQTVLIGHLQKSIFCHSGANCQNLSDTLPQLSGTISSLPVAGPRNHICHCLNWSFTFSVMGTHFALEMELAEYSLGNTEI